MLSSRHVLSADACLGSQTDYKYLHILYSCSETSQYTVLDQCLTKKTLNEISNFCRQYPLNVTMISLHI